ncbi:MAG: cyclophilin-like fold protein [Armatimonadetes bacterium]|nr:cyclophilin-like fold protein [Armatimonadota bacterium]MDW8122803.1 cyclophilin-like fold protein [Armatimonadota bacterium]
MGERIRVRAGDVEVLAELNESETAQAIYKALPITGKANRWGDEIYFSIPVTAQPENQAEVVEKGDLGYWVPGRAFCIFFGPTPSSRSPEEIRPASPVNVIGRVLGDPTVFRKVRDGTTVVLEREPGQTA